jgi:hypothetical protein
MNELIPQPDALGVPSHPGIFQFLAILTFVLHLIFMNYILGGIIIVTINEWIFGRNPNANLATRIMVKVMPVSLSMAITMGVAPLLFVQVLYGQFFYTANIMMGGYWLAILALVMIAFYIIYYIIVKQPDDNKPTMVSRFGSLINCVLFLSVAYIFTNNAILVENPQYWPEIYAKETSAFVADKTIWPRYLHNVFGAIVVAGLWTAAIGHYQRKVNPEREETGLWMIKNGLHWSSVAIVITFIFGVIYLIAIGGDRLKSFMGMEHGILFFGWSISVITAIISIVFIAMAMMKPNDPKFLWGSIGLSVVTLFGMAMGRDLLRIVSLKQYFTVSQLEINPSVSSLLLFVVTFVLGLLVLAYMIRLVLLIPKDTNSIE